MRTQLAGMVAALVWAACSGANAAGVDAAWQDVTLWYAQPAKQWTEALPIGNGRFGAMFFGGTAGIAEIHLLPALPAAWPQGYVTGLCAQGGFEVDLYWSGGKLDKGLIHSKAGGKCRVGSATPVRVSLARMQVKTTSPARDIIEF